MARADQGCPNNCTFDTDDVAQGIDAARQSGAKVINLSIGGGANSAIANAVKRAADAGIVIVVAAGNEGTQPSGLAQQLASLAPSNVIIVGALGTTNADGSVNYDLPGKWTTPAAGSLGSFLTAPGWLNGGTSATSATGYDLFSGTSFSAPVVAGALALLAQAFPTLTAQQLVTLLYVTADDLGIAGADSTYGRGRLNIGRAFQPVGSLRMANNDQPLAPDQGAVLPAAAGDAAQQAFLAAVILDGFNRAFEINLASSIRQAREASPLAQSMVTGNQSVTTRAGPISVAMTVADPQIQGSAVQQLALTSKERRATRLLAASAIAAIGNRGRMAMGFGVGSASLRQQLSGTPASAALMMGPANDGVGFGTSDIRSTAFAHQTGRLSLAVSGESGEVSRRARVGGLPDYSLLSVSVGYRALHGDARMTVSRVTEAQTFLGGSLPSLMGDAGSQTYFADVDFSRTLGRFWTLSAAYRRGWTQSSAGQFTTSAFSADITKIGFLASRDQLAFRVSQPLRIEGGGLELLLPSSWNYSTKSSTSALRRLALSPSGRELRAELGYFTPIPGGWMSLNAFGRRAPGHDNSAGADLGISVRIRTSLGG